VTASSFTCPRCGTVSYHPDDIRFGYCGRCHWWTGDPQLGALDVIAQAEQDGAIDPVDDVRRWKP